jgi:hypothetical protein
LYRRRVYKRLESGYLDFAKTHAANGVGYSVNKLSSVK